MRNLSGSLQTSGTPELDSATAVSDVCSIIPGLPNDLACLCLAFVPLCHHGRLKVVCKTWHTALSSKFMLDIRSQWEKTEEFLCVFRDDPSLTCGELFDPRSEVWALLPLMPCDLSTYGLSNFHCAAAGTGLLVIGGSLFDARSFPRDKPLASSSVFKYDPSCGRWERLSNMRVPRGSFACGVSEDFVIVAGGGSRHPQFPAEGNRVSAVERYEMKDDRWHFVEGLRSIRAGCVGFLYQGEFWVIGGYGSSRTIAGVLPADEYYRDGEVLDLKTGRWRYLQPMWKEGERRRLGKVAVINTGDSSETGIFMLDDSAIFRYNVSANVWIRESVLPRKALVKASCRVVALDGELFVLSGDRARSSIRGRKGVLFFQVYHPKKRTWRFVSTQPRLNHSSSHPWAAACTIRL